jgi:sugar lactone lactonase YvrE
MTRLLNLLRILLAACLLVWGGLAPSDTLLVAGTQWTGPSKAFYPRDVAVDPSGTLYVSDSSNNCIWKVTPSGVVTKLAGSGVEGFADGPGAMAKFDFPQGLAVDASGTVYVADCDNCRIRKVTPSGEVTTLAGRGGWGFADGPGGSAKFSSPMDVAVDGGGTVYAVDFDNRCIRKVTHEGVVSTLAGRGRRGFSGGKVEEFWAPVGGAVAPWGTVYVSDLCGIRMVTPAGVITTLARRVDDLGFADGMGAAARDFIPRGVAVHAGWVYVADEYNHCIRRVSPGGVVSTLAGNGAPGYADGPGAFAHFNAPSGVAVDANGTVYVADSGNRRIRRVAPDGVVTTVGGSGLTRFTEGLVVDVSGTIYVADFRRLRIRKVLPARAVRTLLADGSRWTRFYDVAVDANGTVYGAHSSSHRIQRVSPEGVVTTLAGGGVEGFADGTGVAARFKFPRGVAVDANGTVYVADSGNLRIRKVTPEGVVTTLAGSGVEGFADGPGAFAYFNDPSGVAVDANGTVYVADSGNRRIRKVTPGGVVTTLAGNGAPGFADGPGAFAHFDAPSIVAVDANGTVYVADNANRRIRKVTPEGVVTTLAGSGRSAFADGMGAEAEFASVDGLAVDSGGMIYVADIGNHRIRQITPEGFVTTLAGSAVIGFADGPGAAATFEFPRALAVDSAGVVYVADGNRLRRIIR